MKNGDTNLMKENGVEHQLTLTNEAGTENGAYLTQRVIQIKNATGVRLAEEVMEFLTSFTSFILSQLSSWTQQIETPVGREVLENKIQLKLNTIGCSFHQNDLLCS